MNQQLIEENNLIKQSYRLSKNYSILTKAELKEIDALSISDNDDKQLWEKIHQGQAFVLAHKVYDKQYIINPTIHYFLTYFQTNFSTFDDIILQLANETGTSTKQIHTIVEPFFIRMIDQGILEAEDSPDFMHSLSESPLFEKGIQVGNYGIEQLITQKRKAELYLARHLPSKQQVVLKVLRANTEDEEAYEDALAYFEQEFYMMGLLKHPNICRIFDYQETSQYVFAAIEYIQGVSPRKVILRKHITLAQRLKIIEQTFAAVAHLHEKGLTHGDIHSSNFLITADNQVKLIDFGFTLPVIPDEDDLPIEGGTMAYIPPECIHSNAFRLVSERVGYAGEVYQLGIIAYILLYDKKPFKALDWHTLCKRIKTLQPIFNTHTNQQEFIPLSIRNFVQKTLNKLPKERFENAIVLEAKWKQLLSDITNAKTL